MLMLLVVVMVLVVAAVGSAILRMLLVAVKMLTEAINPTRRITADRGASSRQQNLMFRAGEKEEKDHSC